MEQMILPLGGVEVDFRTATQWMEAGERVKRAGWVGKSLSLTKKAGDKGPGTLTVTEGKATTPWHATFEEMQESDWVLVE
jgi:hypothetical protein